MPTVELVYVEDCPHLAEARARLLRAFARVGLEPRWREWRLDDPEAPAHVRRFGSPTILVNGRDVAGDHGRDEAPACRLYADGSGVPPLEAMTSALSSGPRRARTAWGPAAATLPAIGLAVLPKVACPACWPAYAGLLTSLGLGFLLDSTVLFPLTAVFLALAVGALAFGARRRRGYGPFLAGLVAAAVVLVGKFGFGSDALMYGGLSVLVAASLWNGWPRRKAGACPSCTMQGENP